MSLLDALGRLAASDGARVAVSVDGGASLTYAEWEARSTAWAEGLTAAAVAAGERVALLFPPCDWTEFAVAYMAVQRIGAVAVPIGSDLGTLEIGRILRAAQVSTVLSPEERCEFPSIRALSTAGLDGGTDPRDRSRAPQLRVPGELIEILAVARPLSLPRLVARSAADLVASASPMSPCTALVHAFPVGTVGGQDALLAALRGSPLNVIALQALETERIAELVASGAAGACALHPDAARALLARGAESTAFEHLAQLIIAGDEVSPWLFAQLRRRFRNTAISVVIPPTARVAEIDARQTWTSAPVAVSQEGMLWHECLAPGCQNLPGLARRYRGPLDVEALRRALDEVLRRHGALRSQFEVRDGELVQLVRPHQPLVLETNDLSRLAPDEREEDVARAVEEAGQVPFDLVSEALFQPTLFRLAGDEHVLVIRTHHTVFDDWSVGVFRRELAALYAAFADGASSPMADLPLQFADVATRQRERLAGPQGERAMAFWRRELSGAPLVTQLPVADPGLPPGSPQASGAPVELELPAEARDAVRSLAQRERVTTYMTMLAAFGVLTARVTGQDDLLLATVVANRNRTELERLIGCFTKKVPMRLRLDGDPTFLEVLARTRLALLAALAHQEPAFDAVLHDVLGPAAARHGLVPHAAVMFQGVTPGQELVLPGVDSAGLGTSMRAARPHFASARGNSEIAGPVPPWGAGLQLGTFVIVTLVDEPEKLSLVVRGAFHGPAMRRLLDDYREMLEALLASPGAPIAEVATAIADTRWPDTTPGVALRGYRVDPTRIAEALRDRPGIDNVGVEVRRVSDEDDDIVAHVAWSEAPPTLAALRAWEWSRLPGYAWPSSLRTTGHVRGVIAMPDPAAALLRAAYADSIGAREISPDTRYWQHPAFLDAVGRARDAGLPVSSPLIARNRTVHALAAALTAQRLRR